MFEKPAIEFEMFVRFVVEFKIHDPSVTFEWKIKTLFVVEAFKFELKTPRFFKFEPEKLLAYCIVRTLFAGSV